MPDNAIGDAKKPIISIRKSAPTIIVSKKTTISEPPVNCILNCDCVEGMKRLPDEYSALTVTSPAYDGLRIYGGDTFLFEPIAKELYRITMVGGVVVWIVQEQVIDGSETGTSSYQRLFFRDLGFRLHHTMVMHGHGTRHHHAVRYGTPLQYALVLSKGRPRHINLLRDRQNQYPGETKRFTQRFPNGELQRQRTYTTKVMGVRGPIWYYATGRHLAEERYTNLHPARMAEAIARDHILTWSRPGDMVFDPMAGVGTTCKMALLTDRRYLGMEVHTPYWEIAARRLEEAHQKKQAARNGEHPQYGDPHA